MINLPILLQEKLNIFNCMIMNTLKLVKVIIVLGILITGLYFVSQYYVDNKDEKLKNEIWSQINGVFDGQDKICDGSISSVQVRQDNISNCSYGEDCSDLVEYYKKLSGGFELVQARKNNQNIDIMNWTSSNMGYKTNPIPNYSNYNQNIPSIDEAYKGAFDYLTSENPASNGYVAGAYQRIQNIPSLSNEYYSLKEIGTLNMGTSYVHNGYWRVFYTGSGYRYAIDLNKDKKQNDFWKIFGFSTLGLLLLSFVFLYNPKPKKQVD